MQISLGVASSFLMFLSSVQNYRHLKNIDLYISAYMPAD